MATDERSTDLLAVELLEPPGLPPPPASLDAELEAGVTLRRHGVRRSHPAMAGGAIVLGIVAMALLAPVISPHDPFGQELTNRLRPPFWLTGGSLDFPLGTDRLGRDLFSRIIFGARITLLIGALSVLVGGAIGVTAGLLAGFYGGWVDTLLGRLADVQQAIPFVVLVLAIVAVLGSSLANLTIVLGVGSWIFYYRVVRGEVLAVREHLYVEAARAVGASQGRIFVRHILPNVSSSIIVVVTLFVPQVIVYTAGLSFLGLGVPLPTPEWGSLIAEGSEYLQRAWWLTLMPGVFLVLTVLAVNMLGDWLRDELDPTQSRRAR